MDIEKFKNSPTGRLIKTTRNYWAFIPNPLPPAGLDKFSAEFVRILSEAEQGIGVLKSLSKLIPNPNLLVAPYVRKEAVQSSRIEGTQASLSDIFYYEASKEKPKHADVLEVLNYVRAMNYGLSRLKELPLSLRLVKEIHLKLMAGVRGEKMKPGEFRSTQNWIGPPGCSLADATYTPPPVPEMNEALGQWEKFLHSDNSIAPLIKCALMHYQFEAIHPFLDGNGRVGRLLITFYLYEKGYLKYPILYLSDFFERYQNEYYDLLLGVSQNGNWDAWLKYFIRGVAEQSKVAEETGHKILDLQKKYRQQLQKESVSTPVFQLLDMLFLNPFVSLPGVSDSLKITWPTAKASVERLVKLGILKEVSGRKRSRIYCAEELLNILAEG
ncbi:MAG: Fic family protein [Candidatus Aminicenantes bacterium]|nr:Fic family protein [Candidatus Aminicenantes bacterium]